MHSCCLYGRQECFCDYSTNQAKHHVSVTAKCLSTDLLLHRFNTLKIKKMGKK